MPPLLIIIVFLIFAPISYFWWITHTQDAPWVPMAADVAARVIRFAEVGPKDVFYDLGSGDGRLVIAAAMAGAKARGVEIDAFRVLYSRFWIWLFRLDRQATIIRADLFKVDISDATVVCTYLLPETHEKLKQKLLKELKPGTKVVAVGFEYKGWKRIKVDPRGTVFGPIMMYQV